MSGWRVPNAEFRESTFLKTFADWAIKKVETLSAAVVLSASCLGQLVIPGISPDLYQASVVRKRVNTKSASRIFQVVVAARARSNEHSQRSPLRRTLGSLFETSNALSSYGSLISFCLRDTGLVRSGGRVVVDSFRTSLAT